VSNEFHFSDDFIETGHISVKYGFLKSGIMCYLDSVTFFFLLFPFKLLF